MLCNIYWIGGEMKKIKVILVLGISVAMVLSMLLLPACKTAEPEVVKETVVETVVKEVVKEVEKVSPYTVEKLREMAKKGEYVDEPAKSFKVGFANLIASFPFCQAVEKSIMKHWELAGGLKDNLFILDNQFDAITAKQNADIIFDKGANLFIQFYTDEATNALILRKYKEAGIPLITIDSVQVGFVYCGVDNYGAGNQVAEIVISKIDEKYGGLEKVDKIYINFNPAHTGALTFRYLAIKNRLMEEYGEIANPDNPDSKVVMAGVGSKTEDVTPKFLEYLSKYPEGDNIIVTTGNDQQAAGVVAAAEMAGRDMSNWLIVSQGCDDLGKQLIRDGKIWGDLGYFPEEYGNIIIPVALAMLYGNPVPPSNNIETVLVTADNIDQFYPE